MILGIVAVAVAVVGGLWLAQRRLIYLPVAGVPYVADVLVGWEDVQIRPDDGIVLGGWYHSPANESPVVIVFNGNAGNRAGRTALGMRLAGAGYGVLLFDYRGYGDSSGTPTEAGLARDALAAAAFVADRASGHPVVYFGESLGAAVAIGLAVEVPPAALVLRSPFTSLPDVASLHYPLPLIHTLLWDEYPSLERTATLRCPTLVIAGSADSIVPVEQSRRIFSAAPEPKHLVIVEGADHNDLALLAGDRLIAAVTSFVSAHVEG